MNEISICGGFLATLTIIFVIFKLLGYITWSWWIVFLPMLVWIAIPVVISLVVLFILWWNY